MASRTQQRANAPAPPWAHGPPSALCVPQAHSARTGLAPNSCRGDAARLHAVAVHVLGTQGGASRFGRRARLPEPAEGPGDLDAAADAPEPDESEDRCGEEDVQHGEEVGITRGGLEYEFEDMEHKAANMDELGRYIVKLEHG